MSFSKTHASLHENCRNRPVTSRLQECEKHEAQDEQKTKTMGEGDSDRRANCVRRATPPGLTGVTTLQLCHSLDTTYLDRRGRPRFIVEEGGEPIAELF